MDRDERDAPVNAKAFLIDSRSLTVLWVNESAAQDFPTGKLDSAVPIESVTPVPGVRDALESVAASGLPRHLSANLVSTVRGSLALAASVYRLPDGDLLLLVENAWQADHAKRDATVCRRPRRRGR